ncbi:MAG: DUF58 domain-containing protein [Alicyclobacillus sp.]|nr:DUF58 domain-containing protein [Alicyclobacillus sp.]
MYLLPLALLVLVWVWPHVWFKVVRGRLSVEVEIPRRQVEPNKGFSVLIRVRNRAWLPCPFVKVNVELPPGLSAQPADRTPLLTFHTFLMLRQQLQVELPCYGMERGVQRIRHVVLHVNDGLGLKPLFLAQDIEAEVVVLPGFAPVQPKTMPMKDITGKLEVVRWLHPDESLLRGIRQYRSGDPFKHIAWQASARTGSWMTKQFSASTEATVCLLVNAQLFDPHWIGTHQARFNYLCDLATTWSHWLAERGFRLQFLCNATMPRDPRRQWHGIQSPVGMRLLLGRAMPYTNASLDHLLRLLPTLITAATPLLLFTSFITPGQWRLLESLARDGREIIVIGGLEANFSTGRRAGIPVLCDTHAAAFGEDAQDQNEPGTQVDQEAMQHA